VRVAQAEVDKARLDFEHAVMRAPEDGWIARAST
jgi:multidrug resistance efflux pump